MTYIEILGAIAFAGGTLGYGWFPFMIVTVIDLIVYALQNK